MTDEMRCAECDCENGGSDCNWIRTRPELLPCPFCGGEASLVADADHSAAFIIITHCSDTCTIADHWDWRPSMSEAIAACNTRADLVLKAKALEWEKLDDNCFRAWLPLFGNVRVENYTGDYWLCTWSVPGYSNTFVPGHFGDAEEAKEAAFEKVAACILSALETPETET